MTRRPLLELLDLPLRNLPAELEGVRLAHISDLHVRKDRYRFRQLVEELTEIDLDLACYTGDYMTWPGDEGVALEVMERVAAAASPRLGQFGVFGNHDSAKVIRRFESLPVRWLINDAVRLEGLPLELSGLSGERERAFDAALMASRMSGTHDREAESRTFHLLLSHHPYTLIHAADLGMDLMLAGHSHGGQCRLPGARALANSSRLPNHLTAGRFSYRGTEALVCRGSGEVHVPFRMFCPPHVPIYVLRRDTSCPSEVVTKEGGFELIWSW
ncbi:MAG: metallophosphoesterase [Planctomycetota bacterium]